MTANHILVAAGITVSAVTAIWLAYLQRKQMRQIELFKLDPKAGLLPPSNPIWKFVKSYIDLITGIGIPAVFLVDQLHSDKPLTRGAVFIIALQVAFIFFTVAMHFFGRLLELNKRILELNKTQIKTLNDYGPR